jgi:hypothetical protein
MRRNCQRRTREMYMKSFMLMDRVDGDLTSGELNELATTLTYHYPFSQYRIISRFAKSI